MRPPSIKDDERNLSQDETLDERIQFVALPLDFSLSFPYASPHRLLTAHSLNNGVLLGSVLYTLTRAKMNYTMTVSVLPFPPRTGYCNSTALVEIKPRAKLQAISPSPLPPSAFFVPGCGGPMGA